MIATALGSSTCRFGLPYGSTESTMQDATPNVRDSSHPIIASPFGSRPASRLARQKIGNKRLSGKAGLAYEAEQGLGVGSGLRRKEDVKRKYNAGLGNSGRQVAIGGFLLGCQ